MAGGKGNNLPPFSSALHLNNAQRNTLSPSHPVQRKFTRLCCGAIYYSASEQGFALSRLHLSYLLSAGKCERKKDDVGIVLFYSVIYNSVLVPIPPWIARIHAIYYSASEQGFALTSQLLAISVKAQKNKAPASACFVSRSRENLIF